MVIFDESCEGSPKLTAYAASKAFNAILAEGLWGELRSQGIDVLASVFLLLAGAIRTPGYTLAQQKSAPGTLDAAIVVKKTFKVLGKRPVTVPGFSASSLIKTDCQYPDPSDFVK